MSNQGGWKPDKDSLVLAFFVEFIVYIVSAILVLVIGVVISIAAEDFTHLGRAGALLTLIAISMA